MAVESPDLYTLSWIWEWIGPIAAKIGVFMRVASDVKSYYSSTLTLFILLTDDDDSCYRIEQVIGKYQVSGSSI